MSDEWFSEFYSNSYKIRWYHKYLCKLFGKRHVFPGEIGVWYVFRGRIYGFEDK